MQKKKISAVSLAFAFLILLVVFFLVQSNFRQQKHIVLPPVAADFNPDGEISPVNSIDRIEVTPDTVQSAISALQRPGTYSCRMRAIRSWSGGSSTTTISVFRDGDMLRVDSELPDESLRHLLRCDGMDYIWYDAERSYYSTAALFSDDAEQGLLTYEDVLSIEKGRIAVADYRLLGEEECIYIETSPDSDSVSDAYWVSTRNGLLVAERRTIASEEIYFLSVYDISLEPVGSAPFTLPDGKLLR